MSVLDIIGNLNVRSSLVSTTNLKTLDVYKF